MSILPKANQKMEDEIMQDIYKYNYRYRSPEALLDYIIANRGVNLPLVW